MEVKNTEVLNKIEARGSGTLSREKKSKLFSTRGLVMMALFGAVSAVLMLFEIPIPIIAPPFYKMDLSEVPVLIGSFSLGPAAGVIIELIKILLKLVIKSSSTAGIGDVANFLIGCAFVVPAGIIYQRNKTKKGAIVGMVVGILTMVIAGSLMNGFVLLPVYAKAFGGMEAIIAAGTAVHGSVDSVFSFVALCVAPFNILKGIVVSILTLLLYKRISPIIKKGLG